MPNASRKLNVPTMPKGVEIASFGTYLDAQAAVDHLSDKSFPVQHVTIVGTDLKMVERVTGRLTYGRVTLAGLAAGAWFGLFVGILLYMFGGSSAGPSVLAAIALGAGFGALFSLISYSLTGGKRDFTSSSQIVAASYTLLCSAEHAAPAREFLRVAGMTNGLNAPDAPSSSANPYAGPGTLASSTATGSTAPTTPATGSQHDTGSDKPAAVTQSKPDHMYVTSDGRPRYGALRDDAQAAPTSGTDSAAPQSDAADDAEQQRDN